MALSIIHTDYAGDDGARGLSLGLPDALLAPYVVQFFEVKIKGVLASPRERVMPMGDVAVIVNLGPVQRLLDRENHDRATEFNDAFVSGVHAKHLITESPFGSWMCGMRLTPRGAFRFLGEAPTALTNRVVTWHDVYGPGAESRIDQLRCAGSADTRFEIFAAALKARLADAPDWDPAVVWAMGQMHSSPSGVSIGELARDIGWSRQKLHGRFSDAVGLAPKAFARVLRFQETIRAIGQLARPDFAAIAHDAGYYDQAHFNHDFRDITGLTPTEFLRLRVGGDEVGFARVS